MKRIPTRTFVLFLLWLPLASTSQGTEPIHDGNALLREVNAEIANITTDELVRLIETTPDLVLIDVRMPEELAFVGGTIDAPVNLNITRGWLEFQVPERITDRDTPIVVYCGLNLRSPLAARTLVDMGYTNVSNYEDAFTAWLEAGLPVTADDAPRSFLFRKPQRVVEGVWSAIGATAPPSYTNSGHNNNLSFIITTDGVVVVNAGDNYLLAQSLHQEIREITDIPVKYVILENGQGHAMLGMDYWQQQGALVVAHEDTAREIEETGHDVLESMVLGRLDKSAGTVLSQPDITFSDRYVIELGGERIEAIDLGPAHSPGDIVVWLPSKKVVISGDVAFHQRLLPVFEHTDTDGWIETWDRFLALGAKVVIPGHGGPTSYDEVTKYTRDYLVHMREVVGQVLENDGDLQEAYGVDQSAFDHLDTYYELYRQNAGRIFREMEFEF